MLCKYFAAISVASSFAKLKRQHVKLKYLEDIKQLVIKNTFNRRNHQKADKQYKNTHKGALK